MRFDKFRAGALTSTLALAIAAGLSCPARAGDLPSQKEAPEAPAAALDPWSGFYAGGHFGYAWGNSNWTAHSIPSGAPLASGSLGLFQPLNSFAESGSFFNGVQAGYNRMLPNRWVIGAEADVSGASFQDVNGNSIGGTVTIPALGRDQYSDNVLVSGTVRGRAGYALGSWFVYATGGLAWSYEQLGLASTGELRNMSRLGWAAGGGVEAPLIPNWTAKLEYLVTGYGTKSTSFPAGGVLFASNMLEQQLRLGLNYHFDQSPDAAKVTAFGLDPERVSIHGQGTFTEQAMPPMRSPYEGPFSLPGGGGGRETVDLTLYAGFKLWQGAELWLNPEADQGFGLGNTHGVAGFPSGESYKLGWAYPYARVQRYFIRQTIDLGGETQNVDADVNQFAGTQSSDRVVLTVGKFGIVDIFDTNKYANNPKTDFLNWALINGGTFDYAGDAWGYTYGAAAEWYKGNWTLRGGVFDLSATPAGGSNSPLAYGLDQNFHQLEWVGEIENRHDLWGQPGKIKLTGFVARGVAGTFADAISTGTFDTSAPNVRDQYRSRPGASLNIEQQVNENIGVFARLGFANGNVEPWDFTDIDRTLSGGGQVSGKLWGRPDDTVGLAGILNDISNVHQQYFAGGGNGILAGYDGKLPNPGLEQILEAYYSYALNSSIKVSFDYQLIVNPAYNADRGPANVFASRLHWQF